MPVAGYSNTGIELITTRLVRRGLHNNFRAAAEDAVTAETAAGYTNVRARGQATAYTAEPALSTDWFSQTSPRQHHTAPLTRRHQPEQVELQQSYPVHANNVTRSQHQGTEEADPSASAVLLAEQVSDQQKQQHATVSQSVGAVCTYSQPELLAGSDVHVQRQAQHSHRSENQVRQGKQRVPRVPSLSSVRVANTTSPNGLASYLVNKLKLQLDRHKRHMTQCSVDVAQYDHSSSSRVTMCCSSSVSLLTALHAIALAAEQAISVLGQPYQLLMRPQLVQNALSNTADGGHSAGAYQLHLFWVPLAGAARFEQQDQQRTGAQYKLGDATRRRKRQQEVMHPIQSSRQPVHHMAETSKQAQQPDTTAITPSSTAVFAAHSNNLSACADHLQYLDCDPPQQVPRQHKRRHKSNNHDTAHPDRVPHHLISAGSLSWQVSGLLRGGWPAQLRCSSAVGALTAVRALVKAQQQLAASDGDLLVMVHAAAEEVGTKQDVDGSAAARSAPLRQAASVQGSLTLWATNIAPDRLSPAAQSQVRGSSSTYRAEVVGAPAAEQHLQQQLQHRRRRKQLSALSQQQKTISVGWPATTMQQQQQTSLHRQQQPHQQQQLQQHHQRSWSADVQESCQSSHVCSADIESRTVQWQASDAQQRCHVAEASSDLQQQLEQQQHQSTLSGLLLHESSFNALDKLHIDFVQRSMSTHTTSQQQARITNLEVPLAAYVL